MSPLTTLTTPIVTEAAGTPRILLVDDDSVLLDLLGEYLEAEGCSIDKADNGVTAVERVEQGYFDLVVLDIMMPKLNGIEALKQIRAISTVPVIMLTARGDDLDRILGLELGADDYVPKPCNPRELYARIKAVLRRTTPEPPEAPISINVGDLALNSGTRTVIVGHRDIVLTQTEVDLLKLLLLTPDQVIKKSDISMRVLEKPLSQWDRSIDVHISNLRKKLGKHKDGKERIRTLRGSGYLYVNPQH
ncbi:MAG: response regulator transcription factor [Gammaproteobacteria bacterium]